MQKAAILASLLILGCTTTQSQPVRSSEFRNLQILPQDIPREELLATMRSFTRALGVRCNFCHVVTATEPKEVFDFPSDANEHKRVARVMMRMTRDINREWLTRAAAAEGETGPAPNAEMRVTCWTCHRGHDEPEMPPPPPPDQAR